MLRHLHKWKQVFIMSMFMFSLKMRRYPSTTVPQRNTVIKYTKLPDFDIDDKVSWPRSSYMLAPRLRRIIVLDDQLTSTSRSLKFDHIQNIDNQVMRSSRPLKYDYVAPQKITSSNRKIVTISEDDSDLHPKFSKEVKKTTLNKAVATDNDRSKEREKSISRLTSPKYSKNTKPSAKSNNLNDVSPLKLSGRSKTSSNQNVRSTQNNNEKAPNITEKETTLRIKSSNMPSNISTNKTVKPPSVNEVEMDLLKKKLIEDMKTNPVPKKTKEISKICKSPQKTKSRALMNEIKNKNKPVTLIHVPLEEKNRKPCLSETEINKIILNPAMSKLNKVDCGIEVEISEAAAKDVIYQQPEKVDKITEIERLDFEMSEKVDKTTETVKFDFETSEKIDKITEIDKFHFEAFCKDEFQMDMFKKFDSLDIPNVTLIKDKSDISKDLVKLCSRSLPNLQVPTINVNQKEKKRSREKLVCNGSASYIIGRATLTYTTRQKINFHVVGKNENMVCNVSSPLNYPMNVVSIFKEEITNRDICDSAVDNIQKDNDNLNPKYSHYLNEIKSLNCSYALDSSKLMKPSDIISTIAVNDDLLQSDYICEQFQRELNFIDSFFESLQYLESCSLSDKCFKDNKVENWVCNSGFDIKNPEYDSFFSKLQNGAENEDTETMASKSLCLLNLLIRDEQRRAKNLLFVLKMREDALKDFTKSQILWLENKKKQDSTDISTLKKKQRGALLKLQHECGEMQRMRKALLALSEKRKVALMKTKKNIELKLKSNVTVDQIVLSKKKLKRNTADRNTAPLKCFDLSSSGCEEITFRSKCDTILCIPEVSAIVKSAEKCIQTGDSIIGAVCTEQSTNTAAENFVAVDGTYLNILFHNLSLPQIFSSGKQYEVNEEALQNIVSSSNAHHGKISDCDVIEKFMDQIKTSDLDNSSTPSTARSLVEEFDQYYKGLVEEEKSSIDSPDRDFENSHASMGLDHAILESKQEPDASANCKSISAMTSDSADTVASKTSDTIVDQTFELQSEVPMISVETQEIIIGSTQSGPLPVPEGAVIVLEPTSVPVSIGHRSPIISSADSSASSQSSPHASVSSMTSLTSPVHFEAEELWRQQLAIEREIKALEQQQCQLLVVREIPDKPPPPYTPPTDPRVQKPLHPFSVDDSIEQQIRTNVIDPSSTSSDSNDPFELFVNEYCQEIVVNHKSDQSDKPWDTCNLLPQKPSVDREQLVKRATTELKDILRGVTPTVVSGVGARRADHIDDILFAEWRRCEPEWTSLHTDEAVVKNQIFESIFQKILTETIDEYKKIVPCSND